MSADRYTTYNATDDTFIVQGSDARRFGEIYRVSTFQGIWVGISLVLLFVFLLLSTPQQRRGPIFYIIATSYAMLLTGGGFALAWAGRRNSLFFTKGDNNNWFFDFQLSIACLSLEKFTCFVADLALIFKVRSFYPKPTYSLMQQLLRISPLLILIPPRLALICVFSAFALLRSENEYRAIGVAEFALQIAYCSYASVMLLQESIRFYRRTARRGDRPLKRKIRLLIESTLFTFIVPLCFQVACLIVLARYRYPGRHGFRYLSACNTYTTVHFALLATYRRGQSSADSTLTSSEGQSHLPSITFISSFFPSEKKMKISGSEAYGSNQRLSGTSDEPGMDSRREAQFSSSTADIQLQDRSKCNLDS